MRKKKIERHRFAKDPENPRAMHNKMMKTGDEGMQAVPMSQSAMTDFYKGDSGLSRYPKPTLLALKQERPTTAPYSKQLRGRSTQMTTVKSHNVPPVMIQRSAYDYQ